MPNWKKVIVSGSDASLNSITTPAGTINNITASYAITASHALNGGVTQLLAGPNITLSPTTGKGQVTISATLSGSTIFNTATGSYGSFYDTTTQTNLVANIPRSMSFNTTDITNGVSISGSTSPFNTYIKTENPGVYDIQFSAQLDKTDAGKDEIIIWLRKNGIDLTDTATTVTLTNNNDKVVAAWNWFVNSAANDYYQIIWLSADTNIRLLAEPISGTHPGIPSVILTVNRVDQFLSNTGSFNGSFTGTFTGSLQGTASWATNALTASYTPSIAGTDNYIPRFNGSSALENSVMYDDGTNIGIGTTSPAAKLDIVGTNSTLALSFGNTVPNNPLFINTYGGWSGIGMGQSDAGLRLVGDYSGGSVTLTDIGYYTSGTVSHANWVSRLMVLNNGNVGIGITNPSYKLDVSGQQRITLAGYAGIEYHNTPGTWEVYVGTENNTGNARYNSRIGNHTWYANSSATMALSASGYLGIGTTTPTSNLQIQSNNLSAPAFAVSKSFSGGGDGTAVMHAFGYDSGIANTGIQVGVKGTGGFSATDAYPLRVFNQGTSSFDVKSNNGLKFNLYGSGTYTGTATQKLAVDSSGNVIEIPIGAGPVDGSGTANYITRWVDTDTITTSSIYETGGNIGINNTSPSNLLTVGAFDSTTDALLQLSVGYAGDRTSRGGIVWKDGSAVTGKIYTEYDGTMTSMVFGSLYNSGYTTNQTMIIRGNGNVGIGTVTPAYKLSVVGKIALNDGGNSVFIGDNAGLSDDATANINVGIGQNALQSNITGTQNVAVGNNSLVANTVSNNTAVGSNTLQFATSAINNVAFGSYALNANTVGSSSSAVGTSALILNTTGNHNTAVGNSALRSNIAGSNNVGVGGSVMFNNANGNDNVALGWFSGRYFGTGTSALTDTSGSIFLGTLARANASGEVNQVVIGMNALGLGSNSVVLGNDNITKTVLKGNVGIGTNVPMGPLEIYKSNPAGLGGHLILNNDGSSVGNETAILFNDSGGGSVSGIRAAISSTTENSPYNGDLKFKTGNTIYGSLSTRMIITGAGNVGIGTTSPANNLHVYNASGATIAIDGTGGNNVGLQYKSNGSLEAAITYVPSTSQLHISRGGDIMVIGNSNVGIGTTSPSYLLDVNGTARVTTLIETSALKYKTNIQPLEPQLSKVTQLEPVTFDWLDKPQTKTNIGLIADEVEKIYPEFVSKTEDGEIEGIEYSKLTTVLIQSIKELKEIVDQQQAQINKLLNK